MKVIAVNTPVGHHIVEKSEAAPAWLGDAEGHLSAPGKQRHVDEAVHHDTDTEGSATLLESGRTAPEWGKASTGDEPVN
jgi:hypothetical protein